ncbi:MAG: transposase [Candidatus Helarchaeota archaeon]
MAYASSNKKNLFVSPDIYEGSYKDIFRYVDFNFSFFSKHDLTKKIGRPDYPEHALFVALILKSLALNSSFRTIEAMIYQDRELARLMGFDEGNTPSDSTSRRYFADLTLKKIQLVQEHLLSSLQALGYTKGRIIAEDSTPIDAHCKVPTKKESGAKDQDAKWGKAKCNGGWYCGFKAQVVADAEDYLPLYSFVTPANVSDQKMVEPFVIPLKKMGFRPEVALLDAGYDSEENHLFLREQLGSVSLICPNTRRDKRKFSKKLINYYKKMLFQTTLDKFMPVTKRKKEYRKYCLVLKSIKAYKKYYKMRVAVEQYFATLKEELFLEKHNLMGLNNLQKYIALKCVSMLVIALAALRMGVPEAMRSPKYFQH